jgi:hypothetical protein
MVKADGVAPTAIESDQNTELADITDDAEFQTDIIAVDETIDNPSDADKPIDVPTTDDTKKTDDSTKKTDDSTKKTDDAPIDNARILEAAKAVGLTYADDGYTADDDSFEAGVVVDEPVMA